MSSAVEVFQNLAEDNWQLGPTLDGRKKVLLHLKSKKKDERDVEFFFSATIEKRTHLETAFLSAFRSTHSSNGCVFFSILFLVTADLERDEVFGQFAHDQLVLDGARVRIGNEAQVEDEEVARVALARDPHWEARDLVVEKKTTKYSTRSNPMGPTNWPRSLVSIFFFFLVRPSVNSKLASPCSRAR